MRILKYSGHWKYLLAFLAYFSLQTGALALAEDQADPFESEKAAYLAAETDEAKVEIGKRFIQNHPQHEQTGFVTGEVVSLLGGSLNDYEGAVKLAESQLKAAGATDIKAEIQEILLELYGKPGYGGKLQHLVGEMFNPQAMIYTDHLRVMRSAATAEVWSLVDHHVAKATPLATPEAFRAAYPDRDFSDEYVAGAGRNRQGLLKTYAGWSAANQGDTQRALADFNQADDMVRKSFLGTPDNELLLYWGKTLVMSGDETAGLEKLAVAGLFGTDHDVAEQAHQIYLDLGRSDDKYDDYLWQMRRKHGVNMVDFAATDYDGNTQTFNGLKGKKATLLAFWFPT